MDVTEYTLLNLVNLCKKLPKFEVLLSSLAHLQFEDTAAESNNIAKR
jgi:hypothetical protein